jgi:hypothetical protein
LKEARPRHEHRHDAHDPTIYRLQKVISVNSAIRRQYRRTTTRVFRPLIT